MSGIAQQSEIEVETEVGNVIAIKPQTRRRRNKQSQSHAQQIEVHAETIMSPDPDHTQNTQQEGVKQDPRIMHAELDKRLKEYTKMGGTGLLFFVGTDNKERFLYSSKKFSTLGMVLSHFNTDKCEQIGKAATTVPGFQVQAKSYRLSRGSGIQHVDVIVTPL